MSLLWIAWAAGVATLPTLWLALRVITWVFDSTASWYHCPLCTWRSQTRWDRLKRIEVRLHERRSHPAARCIYRAAFAREVAAGQGRRGARWQALREAKAFEAERRAS